jgi:hypothetical protein
MKRGRQVQATLNYYLRRTRSNEVRAEQKYILMKDGGWYIRCVPELLRFFAD